MNEQKLKGQLMKISIGLDIQKIDDDYRIISLCTGPGKFYPIYDFKSKILYVENMNKYLTYKQAGDLLKLLKIDRPLISTSSNDENPFRKLTDHLAEVLLEKNRAYGDSFTKSVDQFGNTVIAIRLSDKFNRICSLIGKDELKENDESLQDTLLDMAGYSILALKYLKEHENE